MSRFFVERHAALVPYTPGEQPQDRQYIKLNTNESPFSPPASVTEAIAAEGKSLQLYSDPACRIMTEKLASVYRLKPEQIIMTNGSDEVLHFAFMAFADEKHPLCFADITYGFYEVFAELHHLPYTLIPLEDDFSLDIRNYLGIHKTIVIANPNAPTGLCLSLEEIEAVVRSNPENVVIIDEAYVDFGAESAVSLIQQYENLLVTQTFSKSRSMAGARLGFGMGNERLIADLHTLRNSTNPYNVNRMTAAAGYAALCEQEYFTANCKAIADNREWTAHALRKLGFTVLPSSANFVFVRSDRIDGKRLYQELKKRGILIRHFDKERIIDYNRITIGTKEQMHCLTETIATILEEQPYENGTN